jgi:hypothetical protein
MGAMRTPLPIASRSSWITVAAVVLLGATSCARPYRYDPDAASRDLPAAQELSRDRGTRDLSGDGPAPRPDALGDHGRLDRSGEPDLPGKPDLFPKVDATGCSEATTIQTGVTACSQQCVAPLGDADCDGLPDIHRDPSSVCNRLLSFEHFTATTPPSTWQVGPGGSAVLWSCGAAALSPGSSLQLSPAELLKIPDGKFLIEVKYTLGPLPTTPDWSVRLGVGKPGSTSAILCEQWHDPSYGCQGGVHLVNNAYCGSTTGSWNPGTQLNVSAGTVYFLQLYSDGGKVVCRLASPAGLVDELKPLECITAAPASVRLSTTRAIAVDQIRIFQL